MDKTFTDITRHENAINNRLIHYAIVLSTCIVCFFIFHSPKYTNYPSIFKSITLTLFIIYFLKHFAFRLIKNWSNTALFVLLFLISTTITTLIYYMSLEFNLIEYPSFIVDDKIPLNLILSILILISILDFFAAYLFHLLDKTCQLVIEKHHNEIDGHRADFKALYLQYDPFFLHNSISNLKLLIEKEDYENAIDYNAEIVSLLNQHLKFTNKEQLSLGEEFEWLKNYLYIENINLNSKLSYQIDVLDEELYMQNIPTMLLQPVIQTILSQQHGFNFSHENLTIMLQVSSWEESGICIDIESNITSGFKQFMKPIILSNLERRIKNLNEQNKFQIKLIKTPSTNLMYKLYVKEIFTENVNTISI